MRNILDRYLSIQADDELVAQRGKLFNLIILVTITAVLLSMFITIAFGPIVLEYLVLDVASLILFGALYWYTRRGHRWTAYVFLAFMVLLMPYAFRRNLESSLILALAVPVMVVPLIATPWLCIPVAAVESVILYMINLALDYPSLNPLVIVILGVLGVISWLSSWSLENALKEARRSEGALAESNRELQDSRGLLEAHTHELERRSAYLQTSAEIGRAATTVLETDRLVQQVVELIREQFDLYYVGLFLVDETGKWAVLQAGTGEAGRVMLARGHRIKVGEGMIGWSVAYAQARVALEAGEDAVRLATTELPDTRSEAALPLRSRGQILGALTVQSTQPGAFDQDTIVVLQTMTDQVAVALNNARLFAEVREALEATRRAYGELSREVWAKLLHARPDLGFIRDERGISPAGDLWRSEMETVLQTGKSALSGDGTTRLATPIKVRGRVIGVIDAHKPNEEKWTSEQTAVIETLADQLGAALESARLYEDAQRRAARERLAREITDKMRRATNVESIVQTVVDELFSVMGTSRAFVRLVPPSVQDNGEDGHK